MDYKDLVQEQVVKFCKLVALVLRGDKELNDIKAEKHPLIAAPLTFASDEEVEQALGCKPGSIGPLKMNIPVIADRSVINMADFICGANEDGFHLTGANWDRDVYFDDVADLRNVVEGDPSPCGNGELSIKRGIEVGHIFQLGRKYTDAFSADVLGEDGKPVRLTMGSYGIGVSRLVAVIAEQHHDELGLRWPSTVSPFDVHLVIANKDAEARAGALELAADLDVLGTEVLLDDRTASPGVKFKDAELLGVPWVVVVGRGWADGVVELRNRFSGEKRDVPVDSAAAEIARAIS